MYYFFLVLSFLLLIFQGIKSQALDSATIYVPLNSSYILKCINKTEGVFSSLVWTTNAYSKAKRTAYSYDKNKKEIINAHFRGRINRYHQTSIEIKNARVEDSGNWECNILFMYTPKEQLPRLRVRELAWYDVVVVSPPVITTVQPRFLLIQPSKIGSVYCDVRGPSPFNITWEKVNGKMSSNVKLTEWIKIKDGIYKMRSHLNFENFQVSDRGTYKCIAHNIGGKVVKKVDVKIQVHPKIKSKTHVVANIGKSTSLVCKATGYPRVTFTWKFNTEGRNISLFQEDTFHRYEVARTIYRKNKAISRLFINHVKRNDWNVYVCIASNSAGRDTRYITLTGFSVPKTPTMLSWKELAQSYITLKWNLGNNFHNNIASITVEYKESSQLDWSKIQVSKPLSEYTIMSLRPGTYYDFRVLSTNNIGSSDYSDMYTVRTKTKEKTSESKNDKIIWNLNLVSLAAVCGGVLLAIACTISCCCLLNQERTMKKRRKRKQAERKAKEKDIQLNIYS